MMPKKSKEIEVAHEFPLDHDEYNKVSRMARLREIRLIASSYVVRPEVFEVTSDLESMRSSFSGVCTDFIYDVDEGVAWGRFKWVAEIKSGKRNCLKLVSEYLVSFSETLGCDEAHVEVYFQKVGRFATYPYFRGAFSHNIGETGIMLPPLPTLSDRID